MQNKGVLARRSAVVSLLTAFGVASGFIVDVLLVARYGVGSSTDAFFLAYTLPLMLVTCAAALQPVLVTVLAGEQPGDRADRGGQALLGALLTAAAAAGLALAGLGTLAARPIVAITGPGSDAATVALGAQLARILFWRVPASAGAEVLKAGLYARGRFGLATLSNAVPSLVTAGLLVGWRGVGIHAAAVGLTAGALAQAALLAAATWRLVGVPRRPATRAEWAEVRRAGGLAAAPLAALVLRQGVTLAERVLGSFLPAGGVTALSYAGRLTMVAAGVMFDGINTAGLPSLAADWARGAGEAARAGLRDLLRLSATVAVPCGLALAAWSGPLVRLFFQRGQVDAQAAGRMAAVLGVYALSLPFLGPYRSVQTFFYAARRPRPVIALHGCLAAVTVALDLALVGRWGARGLALGQAVGCATALAAGLVWLALMVRRAGAGGRLPAGALAQAGRLAAASIGAAAVLWWTNQRLEAAIGLAGGLAISGLAGLAAFAALGMALRLDVVVGAWTGLRRGLRG